MAHKTLINGTSYEITGGRAKVDGTGYEIKSGKTLVDGTEYGVGFGPAMATITVTGTGSSDCVRIYHVENNWETYYEPTTFTAKIGDTISCELIECWYSQYLYINGEMMEGGYGENDIYYTYTVVSDAVIDLYQYDGSTKRDREGKITITET